MSLVAHHGRVENTGTINADGGDSTADAGGDAGSVYLQGATGVHDSGSISARGGGTRLYGRPAYRLRHRRVCAFNDWWPPSTGARTDAYGTAGCITCKQQYRN